MWGGYTSCPILGAPERSESDFAGQIMSKNKSSVEKKGPGLLLISVGTMLSSMVISGFLLGYWLDAWLETAPIFMLVLGALGIIGGFLKVYRLLNDPHMQ
jgi:F0F1-type ATP synthase assembly protein I